MGSPAFWIDPYGTIIPLTADRHIHEVIAYPEKFGTTKKDIDAIYKKHKEPPESEGYAREEIFIDLIKKGWVRIRYHNAGSFTIQLWDYDSRTVDHIYDWAKFVTSKKQGYHKYTDVVFLSLSPREDEKRGNLDDILHFKIFSIDESKNSSRKKPLVVRIAEYLQK